MRYLNRALRVGAEMLDAGFQLKPNFVGRTERGEIFAELLRELLCVPSDEGERAIVVEDDDAARHVR